MIAYKSGNKIIIILNKIKNNKNSQKNNQKSNKFWMEILIKNLSYQMIKIFKAHNLELLMINNNRNNYHKKLIN